MKGCSASVLGDQAGRPAEDCGPSEAVSDAEPISDARLDLFGDRADRDEGLDTALWTRWRDRSDQAKSAALSSEDAAIAPLLLSLARLAAQRDARLIIQAHQREGI